MKRETARRSIASAIVALAIVAATAVSAQGYSPTPGTIYQLPSNQACLKGRGNCAIYPKAAQLTSGRLVASFELSTVPASGSAVGQTLPVYKSDDDGTTWQLLSQVQAPAYLSSDPSVAKYTSAWTNPYLYVLPQQVGALAAGTLVLAAVVSGDDEYYLEQKAANPNWTPTNDGDRKDMAIALYTSTDSGASWTFRNIVTGGSWQGGSAGAIGVNVSAANTYKQVDPVWEPYLMVYNGQLVAYYSDENDFTGYNATTGVPTVDPNNATATDSDGQILAHRTWDGTSASWSGPVVDVSGTTVTLAGGKTEIGGGRPGMANVVQTSDGKWMLTYEYWGGGDNVRYKVASDPLHFFSVGGAAGTGITTLPVTTGTGALATGGSPVLVRLPDGRILFNAAGSGNVWMNASGSSTASWTAYQTTMPGAYSRNLTYDATTGRVVILANQGTSTIINADIDFGHSTGTYYQIVNKLTGQVIGTTNNTTDANIGNADSPDVRLEAAGSAANPDTQLWHITTKSDGNVTLLNKSGGRAAEIWTGNATQGQQIGQWVDNTATGLFTMVTKSNGYVYFQSVQNRSLYLTGSTAGAKLSLQPSDNGAGSQDWQLVAK
ncbi:MAG: RICIN domain-containing protein [Leifsonia sp.]